MKYIIAIIFALSMTFSANAQSKNYTLNGTTFTQVSSKSSSSNDTKTKYTWKTPDGKVYPIFLSARGKAYIKRISKNGNEYKQYLAPEVSAKLAKEHGKA